MYSTDIHQNASGSVGLDLEVDPVADIQRFIVRIPYRLHIQNLGGKSRRQRKNKQEYQGGAKDRKHNMTVAK